MQDMEKSENIKVTICIVFLIYASVYIILFSTKNVFPDLAS